MTDPTMAQLYTLDSTVLPPTARVVGLTGREALSELYRFSIGVMTDGEEIDLAAARGVAATLSMRHEGDAPLQVHGMIARASLRHAWGGKALYELVIVPKAWGLTLSRHCRVFVDQSVVEIVEALLAEGGLTTDDYDLRLQRTYPRHHHTCQYKESRWAFLSRLMEREGLYYYFEHGDQREKLVICDHRSFHRPLVDRPARYVPLSGTDDAMSAEAFHLFFSEHEAVPRSVRLVDHDYLKPGLHVHADAEVWPAAPAAQVHYGDHDFRSAEDGAPLAQVEADGWHSRELRVRGRGRVFGLRSGYRFEVDEHPLDSMNGEFLAVEVSHTGCQAAASPLVRELLGIDVADDYRVEVTAIPAAAQYRAPRRTPIPRINGVERAFVDGPAGSDYAQLDEHGRYKVKLNFDYDDSVLQDGEASTWVRMLQPHGGVTEGFHLPLRKNTEVLIVFLGGDPDRPVIAGAVPNPVQPSPVTSDNHTQNVVQTGGASRIEIEDQEGSKYVDIYTPPKDTWIHLGVPHEGHSHTIVFNTEGNQLVNIGGNRDIEVGGPQHEHVVGAVTETYDSFHETTVAGHHKVTIGANEDRSVGGWWNTEAGAGATLKAPQWNNDISGLTTIQTGSMIQKAGDAQLGYGQASLEWGPTGIDIGSVQGTIGAVDIAIPSGANISTPHWNVTSPREAWAGGQSTFTWGKQAEFVAQKIGGAAVKVDATGFKVGNQGINLVTLGVELRKSGNKSDTAGVESKQGGVMSVLKGIVTFT